MERVFKAKEEMRFDLVDGDGFILEEDGFLVPKDSIWYFDYEEGEDISSPIQMTNGEYTQWIEIDIDDLELEFEEIK